MTTFTTGYDLLCDVRVLHRYFLDAGTVAFNNFPDNTTVDAARRAYDVHTFLRFVPTDATREALREYDMVYRPTAEGFQVGLAVHTESEPDPDPEKRLPPAALMRLPQELELRFLLIPTDEQFYKYTNVPIGLMNYLIHETPAVFWETSGVSTRFGGGGWNTSGTVEGDFVAGTPATSSGALGVIIISHKPQAGRRRWDEEGRGLQSSLEIYLPNRSTQWFVVAKPQPGSSYVSYNNTLSNGLRGFLLSSQPLTRYGTAKVSDPRTPTKVLPAPTLANVVQLDGNFYSLIY